MKRLTSLLLLILSALSLTQAQNIGYEVIRTQESPGYFALRVYPGDQLPPLEVETVFVENFTSKAERKQYKLLSQAILNSGTQVISSTQAALLVDSPNYRLVLLGGPAQNRWLQFKANTNSDIIKKFEDFSQTKLGPVYLSGLKADFGGNIEQVRPEEAPYLDESSVYFVGKFDRPIKTRVSLSGETNDLVVQADGVMDLTTFTPHQASGVLPQLWKDLNPTTVAEGWNIKKIITNSFPILLALIGLAIMWLASRPSKLRTGMADQLTDEFWRTPIEETPLYQAWEKSFPWELSDKELKLAQ